MHRQVGATQSRRRADSKYQSRRGESDRNTPNPEGSVLLSDRWTGGGGQVIEGMGNPTKMFVKWGARKCRAKAQRRKEKTPKEPEREKY